PARQFDDEWKIGKPDVVIKMPDPFEVPAEAPKGGVPYKYFLVDPDFKEDKWIQRAEAKAGAPSVVHHIIIFIVPPGQKFEPNNPNFTTLCGTAPGDMPTVLPTGMARLVPKGSRLVFQMHYTPSGKAAKDQSYVGLVFTKEP